MDSQAVTEHTVTGHAMTGHAVTGHAVIGEPAPRGSNPGAVGRYLRSQLHLPAPICSEIKCDNVTLKDVCSRT